MLNNWLLGFKKIMKNVAIIGTGQQGASIAQALSDAGEYEICTFERDEDSRAEFDILVSDRSNIKISNDIGSAVQNADIIVLATPMDHFGSVLNDISSDVKIGAIVTDIGSGKANAIEEIKCNLPENTIYIPAHPIAGKVNCGPNSSDPTMYKNATIVVIPQSGQAEVQSQKTIEKMWQDMGGNIAYMNAMTHDRLYGTISHFEHAAVFPLVAIGEKSKADYKKAGNYMLDITRIAGGVSADMWIPIFKDNNAAILLSAQGFVSQLNDLKAALNNNNPEDLEKLLSSAHEFRCNIPEARARENLYGEVYDIADAFEITDVDVEDVLSISNKFNAVANIAMVKRTLMPTIISAAITLNAKNMEENHLKDVKIADVANPSFKDGSAPMLNNPQYTANLLFDNRLELQGQIVSFEQEYEILLGAIRDNDAEAIRSYMEHVSTIRKEMPPHRKPEEMRSKFTFTNNNEDDQRQYASE